jgi:quinol-cytochrome oxidoreductase complex cytochrome b subunit
MARNPLPTARFSAAILSLALIEWAFFELLRAPYRPPDDMSTFLGTEKYAVIIFMVVLAAVGLTVLTWWAARSLWAKADIVAVAILVAAIVVAVFCVTLNPRWPVTPLNRIMH